MVVTIDGITIDPDLLPTSIMHVMSIQF